MISRIITFLERFSRWVDMKKAYGLNGASKRRFVQQTLGKREAERRQKARSYKEKYKKKRHLLESAYEVLDGVKRFHALKKLAYESESNVMKIGTELGKMHALMYRYDRTTMYGDHKEKLQEYIDKLNKAKASERAKHLECSSEVAYIKATIKSHNEQVEWLLGEMESYLGSEDSHTNEKYRVLMQSCMPKLKKTINYCI